MKIYRFMMKRKGSISIFMAIIILAMLSMSAVMVDGSRLRNATAILQSASDSAAMSVMAKYDIDLKDRYGLMALDETQQSEIQADYMQFLMANLSGELPGASSLQELFRMLESSLGLTKKIKGNFDLYDFQEGEVSIEPIYRIVEPDIMQKQMVEFAKYRGLIASAGLIDLISQASEATEKNRADIKNIESTIDARASTEEVFKRSDALSDELDDFVKRYNKTADKITSLVNSIKITTDKYQVKLDELKMKKSDMENELDGEEPDQGRISQLKEEINRIYDAPSTEADMAGYQKKIESDLKDLALEISKLDAYKSELNQLSEQCNEMLRLLEQAKDELITSREGLTENGNPDVKKELKEDINDVIRELEKLNTGDMKGWITRAISKINIIKENLTSACIRLQASIKERPEDAKVSDWGTGNYSAEDVSRKKADVNTKANALVSAVNGIHITEVVFRYKYTADTTTKEYQNVNKFYDKNEGKSIEPENPNTNQKITESQKDALPSATAKTDVTIGKYDQQDMEYIEEVTKGYALASSYAGSQADLSIVGMEEFDFNIVNSKNNSKDDIKGSMKLLDKFMSIFTMMANFAVNSVMTDMYMMSMFDSRITATAEEWKEKYGENDPAGKLYDAKRASEEDLNLMFLPKAEYENFFTGELEYIIEGGNEDKENINSVYLKIFGLRLTNNFIAIYMNKEIKAAAAAVASMAGPFAPLVQILVMTVIAVAETTMDMHFLVNKGYKIPLIKNRNNLTLSLDNLDQFAAAPNCKSGELLVKYEDYLYFFLLITNRDVKLLRMADLIQLNMQKLKGRNGVADESYKLADHFTYLRCSAQTTIKPLFMAYGFVPKDIQEKGRYKISTLNYQGY